MYKGTRGFTLIELLVVIAIIGVLSTIVLTAVNSARAKANDARRASDLKSLQQALETYASDNANQYPTTSNVWYTECPYNTTNPLHVNADAMIPSLVTGKYISHIPSDPDMGTSATTCCYLYKSNGSNYKLLVGLNCAKADYTNKNLEPLLDPIRTSSPMDWSSYSGPVQDPNACTGADSTYISAHPGCW